MRTPLAFEENIVFELTVLKNNGHNILIVQKNLLLIIILKQ